MKVNEIFGSIEGEGIRMGYPCTFIRLQQCNLCCSYCDTRYACEGDDYSDMNIPNILHRVKEIGNHRVTVTGGEPLLLQTGIELISVLGSECYDINVETNGSIDLSNLIDYCQEVFNIDDHLIITMDWKSISSGMSDKMLKSNLLKLRSCDVIKFVVGSREDLDQMKELLQDYPIECNIFVSPIFGQIELAEIVDYLIENNIQNVRVQVQLHKIIWDPNKRGV